MAKLTAAKRNALDTKQFAIPELKKYPIDTRARGADAKSRVSANGTPAQKAEVNAAVAAKYPDMGKKK